MADYLIAVLDVESTGVSPYNDHIVQLGTVLYDPDDIAGARTYNVLANPGKPIPAAASAIHGITDERVRYAEPAHQVANEWWKILNETAALQGKRLVLAAHNARFDTGMLRKYFEPAWPKQVPVICTLALARKLDPGSPRHKLGFLVSERYRLDSQLVADAHDALADCWMAALLLEHLVKASGKTHLELAP